TNKADADASNKSKTDQTATATQKAGDIWCFSGCGGNGQEQNVIQVGKTKQNADADAKAKQKALNADVPVSVVGGDPSGDPTWATQDVRNKADADARNKSKTEQDATPTQIAGDVWCWSGCGGNGQEQNVIQLGKTKQRADSDAKAKQKALNANTPVDVYGQEKSYGKRGVMRAERAGGNRRGVLDADEVPERPPSRKARRSGTFLEVEGPASHSAADDRDDVRDCTRRHGDELQGRLQRRRRAGTEGGAGRVCALCRAGLLAAGPRARRRGRRRAGRRAPGGLARDGDGGADTDGCPIRRRCVGTSLVLPAERPGEARRRSPRRRVGRDLAPAASRRSQLR